ncbi:hypothetical protein JW968_06655 [Candidatus Woesearchaeota archaeon]|nr:hypothetical protein [Candidatus Woesearchaeota archaeon]
MVIWGYSTQGACFAMDHILNDIRKSEDNAKKIIEDALKEKEKIISKARADAIDIIKENDRRMSRERDDEIKEYRKSILAKQKEVTEKGRKKTRDIEKSSGKNVDRTKKLLLQEFHGFIEQEMM